MKLLVQRVSSASVRIESVITASIDEGVLVFVGFDREDNIHSLDTLSDKLLNYKIFNDGDGRVSLSLIETNNDILVVPQVTLAVSTRKGTKPSFSQAAEPNVGIELFNTFQQLLEEKFKKPYAGEFGTEMSISLVNEGPITFWFEL